MSEYDEQCALMRVVQLYQESVPELALLFHIPNGGHREVAVAARLKHAGVKAGVPDLFLPVVRYDRNEKEYMAGLWIELKRAKGGRVEASQVWWHDALRKQGYRVEICCGWRAAWAVIEDYLGVDMPLQML